MFNLVLSLTGRFELNAEEGDVQLTNIKNQGRQISNVSLTFPIQKSS
jgi:hypothetical protein